MNDSLITGTCALDISKCFDTINHNILLKKLSFYGFTEETVNWFSSYLSHRGHKVYCHNKYSNVNYVNIGVPQGSVLGPTLFLLYVNDINNYLGEASCNMYADDVLIYCSASSSADLNVKLQSSIDAVKNWYDNNLLVVNASKSSTMLITTRQKEAQINVNDFNMHLGNIDLSIVKHCHYLGVEIDKNLNWNEHVNALALVLNGMVWSLSRLR